MSDPIDEQPFLAQREYDEAKYWTALIHKIAGLAEERKRQRRPQAPAFYDKAFWSAFGSSRFKYLVIFAFGQRLGCLFREVLLLARTMRCNLRASLWYVAAGLHIARRTSRLADRTALAAHTFRRFLRPW